MTESLEEMRELLGPLAPMGEPTEREREMTRPRRAPVPQLDKCGEEVVYSPADAVFLHTREKIDEWDNLYFCRIDYVPKHRLVVRCPNCDAVYSDVVPATVDRLEMDFCRLCGASMSKAQAK